MLFLTNPAALHKVHSFIDSSGNLPECIGDYALTEMARRVGGVKRHLPTVAAMWIDWGCYWFAEHQVVYKEGCVKPKTETLKAAKSATVPGEAVKGFTEEERVAMKERAEELKAEERRGPRAKKSDGEDDVLAKIAEMPESDRAMAERLHAIIKASAPALSPRTWYGMPAYAKDGNVVCFFQSSHKFKARYATLGFSDKANLDEGTVWPVAFALKELTTTDEVRIGVLVKKAAAS